jgi:MraZ protein
MDGQGRFLIPEPLRRFANLEKRIALIGQGNKFEIWDEELWDRSRDEWIEEERSEDDEDLAPELGSLSF